MAKQTIGIGTTANDGTGDPLRTAFDKVNDNFTELYDGSNLGTGVATFLATPSSANLRSALTDETGTGNAVFANMPTFVGTKETVYTITDGAAFEIDPANGGIQVVTLGASRTPAATNFAAGQSVLLGIDDGTAYTITWTTVSPTWLTDSGAAPTLATSGYTWIVLFKVSTTIYAARIA